jgi:3-oxoacyl-[acyl-carrier-protein] synthase-3
MVETSNDWIIERTGIRERHIASAEETIACMADVAARQVLESAGRAAAFSTGSTWLRG